VQQMNEVLQAIGPVSHELVALPAAS